MNEQATVETPPAVLPGLPGAGQRDGRANSPRQIMPYLAGESRQRALGTILNRLTKTRGEPSYGRWVVGVPAVQRALHVELGEHWLSLTTPLRASSRALDYKIINSLLKRNARLQGGARATAAPGERQRQLIVDIPAAALTWDDERELEAVVAAALASVGSAVENRSKSVLPAGQAPMPREELVGLFTEAGWSVRMTEDDKPEVALDVPGNYLSAGVAHDGWTTSLSVPIYQDALNDAPPVCRQAVTTLLWLVAERVRMTKPVLRRRTLTLEVSVLPGCDRTLALDSACAALSVALRHFVNEAQVLLADEALANLYLSKQGFSTIA